MILSVIQITNIIHHSDTENTERTFSVRSGDTDRIKALRLCGEKE